MTFLHSLLSTFGLEPAHAAVAQAAVLAAPAINPDADHTDWHTIAVDKFKTLIKALFNKEVEHAVANMIIGAVYMAGKTQIPAVAAPLLEAAKNAATEAANTAIDGPPAATPGKPLTVLESVIGMPRLKPVAP